MKYQKPAPEQLKKMLSPEQYRVTQEDGTEQPFKNAYWDNIRPGIYVDVVSGEPLFSSLDQYDAGCGWPSFTKPLQKEGMVYKKDSSFGMERTEVRSNVADSHLGHVFTDGPEDQGGMRYCINSASLRFIHVDDMQKEGYEAYLSLFQD